MRNDFFINLLNMSLTGGIAILAVLVLRLILRRAPKVFSYCLWLVVLFRLLCPISFSLPVSAVEILGARTEEQGIVYYIPSDMVYRGSGETLSAAGDITENAGESMGEPPVHSGDNAVQLIAGDGTESLMTLAEAVWAAGVCGLLLYGIFSLLRFQRKLKGAVRTDELPGRGRFSVSVFEKDGLETSFVLGIFRPAIYLPQGLSGVEKKYILLHEQIHIRRMDHIIRLVSFLTLCIHWFNPLVWLAFLLSGKDMEMSCDEAVIRSLGSSVKKEYSASLLNFATGKRIIGAGPLAFGEGDTGNRIRNVLKYHKPRIAAVCGVGILVAAAAVFLLANPMKEPEALTENREEPESGQEENGENQSGREDGQEEGGQSGNMEGRGQSDSDVNSYESEQEKEGSDTEESAAKQREAMRSISRGEELTWKRLKDIVEERNTDLQDYAGYEGAEWDDMDDSGALNRYLIYTLTDEENEQSYRVMISYLIDNNETNQINMLYLMRESDQSILSLYQEGYGGWRDADIDGFTGYIPKLSDWIEEYQFSSEYLNAYWSADDFSALVGDYGGQAFWYTGKDIYTAPPEDWTPIEWAAAATISRVDREKFVFADGVLEDVLNYSNHSERVMEPEAVSGCEEQTVIYKMNCDLFTAVMLYEAEEAGTPVPEDERTVDIWYVCVGREDSPYGYIATLSERYFTEEDVISFARSLKFTQAAW